MTPGSHSSPAALRWGLPALVGTLGIFLTLSPAGDGLQNLSYDLPFLFSKNPPPHEVAIVFLDEQSHRDLNQPLNAPWDRNLHRQLTERLTAAGARLIFFDIQFLDPWPDPAVDAAFARAIRNHGNVILVGDLLIRQEAGGLLTERVIPPDATLESAAAWGLVSLTPSGNQQSIRRLYTGTPDWPTATWLAANRWHAAELPGRLSPRWLFHYGPAGTIPSVSYTRALDPAGVPPDFFRDKAVFIGARPSTGYADAAKDEFSTPYTLFYDLPVPGVELHATAFLNLVRGGWIRQASPLWQGVFLLLAGTLATAFFLQLRPGRVLLLSCGFAGLLSLAGTYFLVEQRLWTAWLVPVAVQIPLALGGSIVSQYWQEFRQRRQLRAAFSAYVSPHLADQLAGQKFSLAPGGTEVPCTILFSDLENFTNLSETLSPSDLSQLLIAYFNRATAAIHQEQGTVIKFIGDAVLAVWGAPLPDERQADRATLAARQVALAGSLTSGGMLCRTRVGVHSGRVLAGNLGSDSRFDYTVIGDAVNLASRLEGMNKMLGTSVLLSEDTVKLLKDKAPLRSMGRFRVKGKAHPVEVFELVCDETGLDYPLFAQALTEFQKGEWLSAQQTFHKVHTLRSGGDPPSQYFLRFMAADYYGITPDNWEGIVNLKDK